MHYHILEEKVISRKFRELIHKVSVNGEIVILIDGDDQPVKNCLNDLSKIKECLSVFGSFYSVIKDSGKYIRFLLITAEFRISRPGIFSGFNNLQEITLRSQYATITGITQEELENNFAEEISELQKVNPEILQDLKAWYNCKSKAKQSDINQLREIKEAGGPNHILHRPHLSKSFLGSHSNLLEVDNSLPSL